MSDYKKIVKSLRFCEDNGIICSSETHCEYFDGKDIDCTGKLMIDAADAIEALLKYNSENRNEIQQIIRSNKSLV